VEVSIQTRNLEINDRVRQHITRKLDHINQHLPGISRALVEVASEPTRAQHDRIVVQVTLDVNGSLLRGEQRGANTTAAINSVAEVLDRRIQRYKSRAYRSERARRITPLSAQQAEEAEAAAAGSDVEIELDSETDDGAGPGGALIRIKRFDMKPMTVEEAAFQMQLLGHKFFMFLNSETEQYNLLYQRDEGDYGLIQPAAGG